LKRPKTRPAILLVAVLLMSVGMRAHAVPSYARELQVPCNTCHLMFPQLTAFGRTFKLNGYLTGAPTKGVQAKDEQGRTVLGLDQFPPLAVMLTTAVTNIKARVPGTQNDSFQIPKQASLFYAGRITPRIGSFIQFTYSQEDGEFGIDNTELRYANTLKDKPITYGAVLNNNPTLEDLWESTPAWGFPWVGPDITPEPAAAPLIAGGLAQDVAGAGGYALFAQKFYLASTLYRSAHQGSAAPTEESENTIDGVAPYWRFAWQHAWGGKYLELGTYGIRADLFPEGISGQTDNYRDIGIDAQYEVPVKARRIRVHATFIREKEDLAASFQNGLVSLENYDLDSVRLDAGLYTERIGYILGFLAVDGPTDPVRFPPAPVEGSLNGNPDSSSWIGEVVFSPWLNVQLRAQYTAFTKFNGGTDNYDGFGRSASDNNTFMLHAWFAW
jgi:hypothetical protein